MAGLGTAHLMRTPMDLRKACVRASVLPISREKISEPAMAVNGVSTPRAWAMPGGVWQVKGQRSKIKIRATFQNRHTHVPMAMAVLPVPGCPAISTARPAIFPSCRETQHLSPYTSHIITSLTTHTHTHTHTHTTQARG